MTILSTRLLHKITMLPMALIMLGAWLFAGSAWSQTTAPQLFGAPFLTLTTTQERNATRTRQVSVDTSLLTARAAEIGSSKLTPQEITLNLFDDVQLIADLVRIERTRNGVAWIGRVRDTAFSQVTFVTLGSIVAGNIVTPAARYQIRHVESGVHEVRANETPPSTATQSVTGTSAVVPRSTSTTILSASTANTIVGAASADNGATIDVMVVYSETAATAAGSEANLLADIDLAVTDVNLSFQESGVNPRIRLVDTEKVAYTETTLTKALEDITGTTDTVLDTIHTLRTTKGADIVSFWVAGDDVSDDECGLAWSLFTDAYAFNVVKSVCAAESNYYGFAHQLGHTMGAGHDAYSGGSGATYAYSHGYTIPEAGVRTIMAMSNECPACVRVSMWSNPSITIGGLPLGDAATADNHRTLNERALTVAGFRTSVAIELQQNVALSDLYGAANSETLYKINVPTDSTNLVITTSGGSGDVDLYIQQGTIPDTATYTCRSNANLSNTETCTVSVPTAGDWYIMLKGNSEGYSGVTLVANYEALVTLTDNVAATPLSGTLGSEKFYKITVPSGQKRLVITTSGGTGNADLYVNQGAYPTTTTHTCASTTALSNAETCTITSPAAGDWYIMLKGTAEYSGLSLLANYSAANITPILMLLLE